MIPRPSFWALVVSIALVAGACQGDVPEEETPPSALTLLASDYPGQPGPGSIYWGSSVHGNGDPVARHEIPSGQVLSIHRTFWQWKHRTTDLVATAGDDHAHGRLPWVSIKTPSWAAMAAGQHDAEIDAMLEAIDALDGPVWLTVHHEPEGGEGNNAPDDPAGPAGHVAMNRRVRERMTALHVDNVALVPIFMSFTWRAQSGRNPDEWWAPGIYDFVGVDHYRHTETSLLDATWYEIRTWAAARGVDVAVGEWGIRGTSPVAGQLVHAWYEDAVSSHQDGRGARVVALTVFDSKDWVLGDEQLRVFHELLGDPRTAGIDDLP